MTIAMSYLRPANIQDGTDAGRRRSALTWNPKCKPNPECRNQVEWIYGDAKDKYLNARLVCQEILPM